MLIYISAEPEVSTCKPLVFFSRSTFMKNCQRWDLEPSPSSYLFCMWELEIVAGLVWLLISTQCSRLLPDTDSADMHRIISVRFIKSWISAGTTVDTSLRPCRPREWSGSRSRHLTALILTNETPVLISDSEAIGQLVLQTYHKTLQGCVKRGDALHWRHRSKICASLFRQIYRIWCLVLLCISVHK